MAVAGSAWVFMSIKDVKLRRKLSVVAVGAMITLAGLVVILRDNNLVQNTFFHTDETSHSSLSSNTARASAYSAGIRSVMAHPLGDGPGSAGPASFRNNGQARIAENYFIQIAQEVGLLGLAIFIAINRLIAKQLYSRRTELLPSILLASLIGITVINMFLHAWTDDTLSLLWWGLAGVSLAKNYTKKHLSR